jgi:D-arabinose 1-dehydrogenase-like Zn-dependent alcohol dehydrogenase
MKAVQITRPGVVRLLDTPAPRPGVHETLLESETVSLNTDDLDAYLGSYAAHSYPVIPGRRVVGRVSETGRRPAFARSAASSAEHGEAQLREGSRVIAMPDAACGTCTQCRSGRSERCVRRRRLGTASMAGGLAELVSVPNAMLVSLPAALDAAVAPFLFDAERALQGVRAIDPVPGDAVLVVGAHVAGILAARALEARDVYPILIDPMAPRRQLALELGLRTVVDPFASHLTEEIEWRTKGAFAVGAFCSSTGVDALEPVPYLLSGGARIFLSAVHARASIPAHAIAERRQVLTSAADHLPMLTEAADLLAGEGLSLPSMVSAELSLDSVPFLFPLLEENPDGYMAILVKSGSSASFSSA